MSNSELDQRFTEKQKDRLLDLKEELLRVRRGMGEDERSRAEQEGDFSEHDSGDMSREIFNREMDATIGEQVERRLEDIDRALQKIEEGTYGLSDVSGDPIPQGRLEAMPEAVRTVEEQQSFERERRPPF